MKHGLTPTLKQKNLISSTKASNGKFLNPDNWLVYKNTATHIYIYSKDRSLPFHKPISK